MKTEKIISVELENDKVIKTVKEVYEDRYQGFRSYDEVQCQMIVDDWKENHKIWVTQKSRELSGLNTDEDWQPEGESVEKDLESYQKYLDKTYGKDKYEAYALGAYIHGSISLALNKHDDTRCRWDSGTVGFVGIDKEIQSTYTGNMIGDLNDAINGTIERYWVYDNYEDDTIDEAYSIEGREYLEKWATEVKDKYGLDFDKFEDANM